MRPIVPLCGLVLPVFVLVAACGETRTPTTPSAASAVSQPTSLNTPASALRAEGRRILMLDQCDPDSFNAAIGPGTCVDRNGGITFDTFIALLQGQQRVPSWRFSPEAIHVPTELTLPIVNAGGEEHTFTEVEEFGGGIVPVLNTLSGNPVPAPECLTLSPSDFIAAGGQTTHTFEPGESDKYQCCIHPWMRATTR
jgi:hypothetical protein